MRKRCFSGGQWAQNGLGWSKWRIAIYRTEGRPQDMKERGSVWVGGLRIWTWGDNAYCRLRLTRHRSEVTPSHFTPDHFSVKLFILFFVIEGCVRLIDGTNWKLFAPAPRSFQKYPQFLNTLTAISTSFNQFYVPESTSAFSSTLSKKYSIFFSVLKNGFFKNP